MTFSRRDFHKIALAAGAFVALPGGTFAAAEEPVSGGTLKIVYFPEPTQLVAINTSAGGPQFIGAKIFDGLLTYDYDLAPKPSLAKEWTISPDGREYIFRLRDGAKFHDGKPVTSADVAFSVLRLKEAHPRGRAIFSQVTDVDTTDPLVAKIRLAKPSPGLITALAGSESPIVPKHIFETFKPTESPKPDQIIGSGPFVLKEWVPGSHILLERNAAYWDAPRPYLDRVIIRLINDAGARAAALETGEGDIGPNPVPLGDLERLKGISKLQIDDRIYAYAGQQNQLVINLENPYRKELKVRQAIAHAIDVKALIDIVLYGYAIPSPTPISPGLAKFHNPDIPFAKFDIALAEKLLDEAGYPRKEGGKRFKLRVTNNPFNPQTYSDFIAQALIKIGIEPDIQKFDFGTYVKVVYTDRTWDLSVESLSNTFDPTAGVQRVYWSKNFKIGLPFSNASHYENPEVDRLLEAAAAEPDIEKRAQYFKDFQVIIARDLPVINLVSPIQPVVGSVKVQSYAQGAEGLGGNISRAWLKA
ncbi:ABC transporter substrate-binding protein [Neorhizobium lilium]|uniref:ABC transporter substrate-binding protein n=1 Tax=Neorhizobium lilium TaxID=2503024 RepID=A0A3S3SAW9_9HYPH|nr:ABC transporter substrate-binding protein [Neorhizobium lilium]RWX81365.1 ABC transporter substrate-binding protein [Neorhizobium lilium]